jgi:hypothetical protein
MGIGIGMPMAIALEAKGLSTNPNKTDHLRFDQDQGVSGIGPTDAVWPLHRIAFEPATILALRTLRVGSEKGYEFEIGGVCFGSCKDKRLWIVFQRSNKDWRVRMRPNLRSAESNEITSSDIPLSNLAALNSANSETPVSSVWECTERRKQ